jgi:hypothetical protein
MQIEIYRNLKCKNPPEDLSGTLCTLEFTVRKKKENLNILFVFLIK